MRNLKFIYLYRDGSNYKNWDEIVFRNPDNLAADEVSRSLRDRFEDNLFVAHQIHIPEIFSFSDCEVTSDDHCYHEFHSMELTTETPSDLRRRSINQFLRDVSEAARIGWQTFERSSALEHSHPRTT
jgi:hypothetical protein